jgi:molybdopterin molybdotransferase
MNDDFAIGFEDAVEAIRACCPPLEAQTVALDDATHRVLAAPVLATDDLVPFARSAMDGYALHAAETQHARRLRIRDRAYAERGPERRHEPGTVIAVATGAPIPRGADAVVAFEDVAVVDGAILLDRLVAAGTHVFPPGEDARRGEVIARAGDVLGPAHLGLLAAAGASSLSVVRKPRVAVITSGEEIVPVTASPGYGEIRNSNATMLVATLRSFGADVVRLAHARDERAALRETIHAAARDADLVVTTGGASVGERDFVKPVLAELGALFAFRSVAMRPARPTAFARLGEARIAALSGNPAAASVALHELVRVAVYALAGRTDRRLPRIRARLHGELHGKGTRTYFAFVALAVDRDGRLAAVPLENQCSALTRTSVDASGFAVLEAGRGNVGFGETIDVDVFDWTRIGSPVGLPPAGGERVDHGQIPVAVDP